MHREPLPTTTGDHSSVADRLLDAAAALTAERGPRAVSMADVAAAAGVSRATLYRYFADRHELHLAYMHREARRIGVEVIREYSSAAGGEASLVAAVQCALRMVRESPLLARWITSDGTGVSADLVKRSDVMAKIGVGITSDPVAARWLLRAIFVLLLVPGADEEEERVMVERFIAPLVMRPGLDDAPSLN